VLCITPTWLPASTSRSPDLIRTLAELSGRRIRFLILPRWFLAAFGRAADVVQRRLKTRLPWSRHNGRCSS
jgi:hypothetical protein